MKPSSGCLVEEMEKELEICDVLCQLGMLVVESRQPELSLKGRMEGPHCPTKPRPHTCDSHSDLCQKKDLIEKEILSLWKNKVPICIEVLLLPACQHGSYIASMPDMSINLLKGRCILLEQWKFQEVHKRPSESVVSIHSLFQAVKSYLYFSQLSAWLNQSHGSLPANIAYRICPPGDFCTNTFHKIPEIHHFPLSSKIRTESIGLYVSVSTLPRQGLPIVPCPGFHERDKPQPVGASNDFTVHQDISESGLTDDGNFHQEGSTSGRDSRPRRFRTSSYCADSDYAISLSQQVVTNTDSSNSSHTRNVLSSNQTVQNETSSESDTESVFRDDNNESNGNRIVINQGTYRQEQQLSNPPSQNSTQSIKTDALFVAMPPTASYENIKQSNSPVEASANISHQSKPCSFNLLDDDGDDQDNGVMFYTPSDSRGNNACKEDSGIDDNYSNGTSGSIAEGGNMPVFSQQKPELSEYQHLKTTSEHYHFPRFSPEFENGSSDGECSFAEIDNILSQALDTQLSLDSSLNGIPVYSKVYNSQSNSSNLVKQQETSTNGHVPKPPANLAPKSFQLVNRPDKLPIQVSNNNHDFNNSLLQQQQDIYDNQEVSDIINANSACSMTTAFSSPTKSSKMSRRSYPSAPDKLSAMALVTPHRPRAPSMLKAVMSKETAANDQETNENAVPTDEEKTTFRRNLCRSAAAVFNTSTGLPLQSSPAPIKKRSRLSFDYDEDLVTVKGIKNSLSCVNLDEFQDRESEIEPKKKLYSTSAPASTNSLLGNFEESMLNGRLEPCGVVDGFTVEIGASGQFCPHHITLPLTAFFFNLSEDNAPSPYLGHINLETIGKRGYHVPKQGTIQVTLFNPNKTVVKMFVVMYDMHDMPASCQTFLRQRTLYIPVKGSPSDTEDAPVYLRYLIHLRFASSKSKKIYLHSDVRIIFARDKFEFDSRIANYELRSFTEKPVNPTFSPKR